MRPESGAFSSRGLRVQNMVVEEVRSSPCTIGFEPEVPRRDV